LTAPVIVRFGRDCQESFEYFRERHLLSFFERKDPTSHVALGESGPRFHRVPSGRRQPDQGHASIVRTCDANHEPCALETIDKIRDGRAGETELGTVSAHRRLAQVRQDPDRIQVSEGNAMACGKLSLKRLYEGNGAYERSERAPLNWTQNHQVTPTSRIIRCLGVL
jgi:hypothetical protein